MIGFVILSLRAQNPYVPSLFRTMATVFSSIWANALASRRILSRSLPIFLCSHAQLISVGDISAIGKESPNAGIDVLIIEIPYGRRAKLQELISILAHDVRAVSVRGTIN